MTPFDESRRRRAWPLLGLILCAAVLRHAGAATADDADAKTKAASPALTWLDSLSKASVDAQRNHRPILVRARGDGCVYCEKLEVEMAQPRIQELLKEWTLVTLDIDRSPGEAQRLNVEGIPALRALSPFGGTIASHDGFLPAAQLADWLKEQREAAHIDRIESLLEEGEPDAASVTKLIEEFQERDPLRREAALRRLRPYPQTAVTLVAHALEKPALSTRLVALDLLRGWKAPIDGLDPWQADSFTVARLKHVADWAASAKFPQADAAAERPLSASDLAAAREGIEKMLTAPAGDIAAMREQLARYGRGLMPLVFARLKDVDSDAGRERLVALRYRLVASDHLPLRWPGGLERLASISLDTRRAAVDELSHLAQAEDEALLLEIFSDPAPLVREIALRSLWTVGTKGVSQSLARLLEDPDPNVRAAVLKQLGEKPTLTVAKLVAGYANKEKDNDLVAHAVRVLRECKRKETIELLKPFVSHPSWQVRAEATEGIGKLLGTRAGVVNRYDQNQENATFLTESFGALVPLLKDPDAFVVSRALQALAEADLAVLVDPMLDVVKLHPEMTVTVIHAFDEGSNWTAKVTPRLFEFCHSPDPAVRAAAIEGLGRRDAVGIDDAIEPLLGDSNRAVRVAALRAFFKCFTARHPRNNSMGGSGVSGGSAETTEITISDPAPTSSSGFVEILGSLLGGKPGGVPAKKRAAPSKARVPLMAERPGGAAPSDPTDDPLDEPLRDIRSGRKISDRQRRLLERIESFVHSNVPDERIAAACALAVAGRDAVAMPALRQALTSGPEHLTEISETLPWLLWNDRKDLFERMLAASEDDHIYSLVNEFTIERDLRPVDLLWKAAASEHMTGSRAYALFDGLQKCYLGNNRWQAQNAPAKTHDRMSADAKTHAASGHRFEQLIGLALLTLADRDTAVEAAQKVLEDEKQPLEARADALRIVLRVQERRQAQSTAVRMLASPRAELVEEALAFLVEPPEYMLKLADGQFYVYTYQFHANSGQSETKNELPKDLKAEQVSPLLRSPREKTVAYAAYLLCMLDHEEGLPILLRYWEAHGREPAAAKLVYQAVAQLNSEAHVPLLARVYQQFQNAESGDEAHGGDEFSVKDFYWTIRTMTGPQILALRKKIREEVGVENLSQ